jgi:hypothetical protein
VVQGLASPCGNQGLGLVGCHLAASQAVYKYKYIYKNNDTVGFVRPRRDNKAVQYSLSYIHILQ